MSGKLRPHGLSSVQTGQVNFCINPNILTYNAQFNFCFPTIKAIPFRGYFERRFHAGYCISTWNQTFKEQCRYSRRVGDHTRLPAAVNPLSHQIPKFFSASSAERCFQRTPTKSRHKGRNRSGREPYLRSQNRQASVTKSSRFFISSSEEEREASDAVKFLERLH